MLEHHTDLVLLFCQPKKIEFYAGIRAQTANSQRV